MAIRCLRQRFLVSDLPHIIRTGRIPYRESVTQTIPEIEEPKDSVVD